MEKLETINIHPNEVVKQYEELLKNPNLPSMQRKIYETYIQNYYLRNIPVEKREEYLKEHSFDKNTNFLNDQDRSAYRKQKLSEMKNQKEKSLHFKKVVLGTGIATLLVAGTLTSLKLHYDGLGAKMTTVRENYDKEYDEIRVQPGQTLEQISREVYMNLPEDVKKITSPGKILNNIARENPQIKNPNQIQAGWLLRVPVYELKQEESKTY